ncbi:reverse transcriptase domain-containing protein [Tanacetum coccineum]
MPYTMYEKLGLGQQKLTILSLELADRSIQHPWGIAEDVLIKIDKFILPIDFVILDMREDSRILIILGRPSLATARSMIDVFNKMITLRVGSEEVIFDMDQSIKNLIWRTMNVTGLRIWTRSYNQQPELLENKNLKDDIIRPNFENHGPDSEIPIQKRENFTSIGFFQIPIAPENQEKTTFTCPYGTFAYRRMSFGLCNALATFQRYMTAIFHDMIEYFMEVFKEDFLLLMKDAKFDFSEDCKKAFNKLKERLITAPIIISPDWNLPFKLMFDASDFAVGAVLGKRIEGKFKPIYYASKTLNDAQAHYTTTEKELLAVVFSFDKLCPYLILSKTIVYTDHSALKYLFSKQDAKPRLIRWVLLL